MFSRSPFHDRRDYRGDVDITALDRFVTYVFGDEDEANVKPIFEDEGVSFVYIQHSNVYSSPSFSLCLYSPYNLP